MACTASPGWFCSPLYNRPLICPENWYCPGGLAMARRCPDNRWSAVGSVHAEDCLEHMNIGLAVIFVLFFMFLVLSVCIWFASWEWTDRSKKPYRYVDPLYSSPGVFCNDTPLYGGKYHECSYGATRATYP